MYGFAIIGVIAYHLRREVKVKVRSCVDIQADSFIVNDFQTEIERHAQTVCTDVAVISVPIVFIFSSAVNSDVVGIEQETRLEKCQFAEWSEIDPANREA